MGKTFIRYTRSQKIGASSVIDYKIGICYFSAKHASLRS